MIAKTQRIWKVRGKIWDCNTSKFRFSMLELCSEVVRSTLEFVTFQALFCNREAPANTDFTEMSFNSFSFVS